MKVCASHALASDIFFYLCIIINCIKLTKHCVGSLKSWESSVVLVNVLKNEIRDGQLSFRGKRVLEVLPPLLNFLSH